MWTTVITGIVTVLVAIIETRAEKDRKANKEFIARSEKREERRKKEQELLMEMVDTAINLSIISSNALTGQQNNGNVEAARKQAKEVARKYDAFLRSVVAEEV